MYIKIKVVPRAKKSKIIKLDKDYLKIKVLSPPIKNKANKEMIRLLADYYNVNKSTIKIIKGEHSREKLVEVLCG
ncbi:DUF167 domain-containing protein [candidate division WOR-3 bacterium]|nr:DUF167 domain-containing protein [candidate division WOR-3 bacterium]